MSPDSDRSGERQRPDHPTRSGERQRPAKGHLPLLARGFYCGHSFVHWTLTLEQRATGWLSSDFHHAWQHLLLHACARFDLAAPAYVLMPDHIHLLGVGLSSAADQHLAIEFLRKHLAPFIAPAAWQKQAHDHVLREEEREHDAISAVAHYIFENPVRAGLVSCWQDYAYTGCCVAGYPELNPRTEDYWLRFWRVHNYLVAQSAPEFGSLHARRYTTK